MKQVIVTIPDNKEDPFIELMKSLSFVTEVQTTESTSIPEWHEAIIDRRTENYINVPESFKEWNEVKKEINKKYGPYCSYHHSSYKPQPRIVEQKGIRAT